MSAAGALRVRAHAKINVSLRVLGRFPDGYHELRTVFQSVGLHDTLFLIPRQGRFALTATDAAVPVDRSNLVWRAAERVWKAARRRGGPHGVHVHLVKRIPVGGGLGGGSSDAAAALRALSAFWRLNVAPQDLEDIARTLGADVPYFLHGGTAMGVDRGDRLSPVPELARRWVVLAMPGFAVSTPDAFAWYDGAGRHARSSGTVAATRGPAIEVANDLEPVVTARHQKLRRIRAALRRSGASAAAMTGSGSTFFGVFASAASANRAARRVAPLCATVVTPFLTRAEFARRSRPAPARRLPPITRIG
jgi:4-diphosphocytidyl-2-C-methyl-D-erythritol kinase